MRAVVAVIDGLGVGSLPDAALFGDEGANTALHVCEAFPGPKWPTLRSLGLGNCIQSQLGITLPGCAPVDNPGASFGVMKERSPGRDTTTGHWEIAGIMLKELFPVFPQEYPSFPLELIEEFERRIERKIIGNKAASGTEIIAELGCEHMRTGSPICYTSGDSVFQIAAHEDVIPVDELYRICRVAREICDRYSVPRVIARPFRGTPGSFSRTERRKDFSLALPSRSVLEELQDGGVETIGIGKIGDLFNEVGLTRSFHDSGNARCLERLVQLLRFPSERGQFIFMNLVDTDMLYGHRRNPSGFLQAVEQIDASLAGVVELIRDDDLLIITADHGCDPTFKGTDHTREHVPLLVYGKDRRPVSLGLREQFSDIAASLESFFSVEKKVEGTSFWPLEPHAHHAAVRHGAGKD